MGRGYLRQFESELAILYRLADVLVVFGMLWTGMTLRGVPWSEEYVLAGVLAAVVFYLCAQINCVYRSWRTSAVKETLWPILISWFFTVFAVLFLAYLTKRTDEFSRIAVTVWILLVPVILLSWRYGLWKILRHLRANGYNQRAVAVAGTTQRASELSRYIEESPETGMKIVGFFDDGNEQTADNLKDGKCALRGDLHELVDRARRREIDMVFVALPMEKCHMAQELLNSLTDTTASVYLIPDLFTANLLGSRWMTIGSIPAVSIYESPFFGIDGLAKRLEDIVLTLMILPIIAVPMMLIALGVKLSSPGPILFKQQRYGLDGRRIRVWKFRTMNCCEDGNRVVQAKHNDTRVTRYGAFLRRTSLDELPQFFNVLAGDMSVVGPRPHAVAHNELYRCKIQGYMLRHKVRPGITGWAQVNGWRGETDSLRKMEKRIECDLWYIRNWSLLLDLRLVIKTIFVGFGGRNAY